KNVQLRFHKLLVDKYGDLMGYLYLKVPRERFSNGKALNIKVKGEHAGSMSWFMVFQKSIMPECKLVEEQAVVKIDDNEFQQFRLDIVHLDNPTLAVIKAGEQVSEVELKLGYNISRFRIPKVLDVKRMSIEVTVDGKPIYGLSTRIMPVTHRTIHLIHHSHVDIGYTHVQEEVLEKQWEWLEMAVDMGRESQKYPSEAHFKWNVEVMWALDQYLKTKPEDKKQALLDAISKSWIELDAIYGNNLMALANTEELIRMTESARETARLCGVKLESAMISDIPGWTWGIVPVLAKSGVRYFSLGTNHGHRIGHTIREWGDKPFYWVSPSGNERVLTWIHGTGYALFHTGLGYENLNRDLAETKILEYIQQLHLEGYDYNIVPLRYNIGSDNGPPDKYLSQFVMDWNEKYVTPRLVISTVSEAFSEFEKKYGNTIPEVSGDFTAFWEDGAISSARETAINQHSAERLVQAEALYAMLQPDHYPPGDFRQCWTDVLLFNEHTWGAWNSISEPESEFTQHQWEVKKAFSVKADSLSKALLDRTFSEIIFRDGNPSQFEVFNTSSWLRTGPVRVKNVSIPDKYILFDDAGDKVAWQKLSTGEIVFIAKSIPPMGSRVFTIKPGRIRPSIDLKINGNTLENEFYEVIINEQSGNISHLIDKDKNRELVNAEHLNGLNEYFYVEGRDPGNRLSIVNCQLSIKDMGPVMVSVIIESKAPGCDNLSREVRLYKGIDYIEIINTLDKQKIYEPEGVHFAFPFNIIEPEVRVDLAYAVYSPEKEQIKGCNKNFFTTERYIDISNNAYGVTVVSPDAPIFEVGDIMSDPIVYGWAEYAVQSPLIFSYIMNNYWETNYLAAQEGLASFQYVIRSHEEFNSVNAEKFSMDVCQPLIGVPVKASSKGLSSLFSTNNEHILLTAVKPSHDLKAYVIRLYNPGVEAEEVVLYLHGQKLESGIFYSNLNEEQLKRVKGPIKLDAQDWLTLRVNLDAQSSD
ncbi:MAG: glycoside hydrolase family 38 C-terminal domain-containing protein, partial [Bacteroidota bacterium]|nr:glycoside hydrolase family 38 C-terminal domain-containing protein [Bacteroidota bacterium]